MGVFLGKLVCGWIGSIGITLVWSIVGLSYLFGNWIIYSIFSVWVYYFFSVVGVSSFMTFPASFSILRSSILLRINFLLALNYISWNFSNYILFLIYGKFNICLFCCDGNGYGICLTWFAFISISWGWLLFTSRRSSFLWLLP